MLALILFYVYGKAAKRVEEGENVLIYEVYRVTFIG